MITFPCNNCREELSVPSDLSGGEIQCPTCGLLVSAPLLSDLPHLRVDGTHAVAESAAGKEANRRQLLTRSFSTRRKDDDGNEIDKRTLPEDIDLAPMTAPARSAPRYDPETGERIDPLDLQREKPIPAQPVGPLIRPGPRTVNYATPGKTTNVPRTGVWIELFSPGNAVVMSVVWIAHVVGTFFDFFIRFLVAAIERLGGVSIPAWPFNLLFWLVVAHYGAVVFETGEEESDELPRPLRGLSWTGDILTPAARVIVAFLIAYGPAIAALMSPADGNAAVYIGICLAVGGALFPALLLAACGSNSLANLRPDRVIRVMRACGWAYVRLAIIATLIVPIYLWMGLGINFIYPLIRDTKLEDVADSLAARGLIAMPLLTICVYAAHGLCWRLGQLQRAHHGKFGWVWEIHETERLAERRKRQKQREEAAQRRGGVQNGR